MSYEGLPSDRHVVNDGSTARDHLANERTLLSWVRTSISLIALGVAVAKVDTNMATGLAVGSMLVVLGIAVIVTSRKRYHDVLESLEKGEFRIHDGGIDIILGAIVFVAVVSLIIVVATA